MVGALAIAHVEGIPPLVACPAPIPIVTPLSQPAWMSGASDESSRKSGCIIQDVMAPSRGRIELICRAMEHNLRLRPDGTSCAIRRSCISCSGELSPWSHKYDDV